MKVLLLLAAVVVAVVVDEGHPHFPITVIVTIMVRKIDVPRPEEGVVAVTTGRVVVRSRVGVVERGALVEAVAIVGVPRKYVLHRKSIVLLDLRRHPSVLHPRVLRIVSIITTKAVRHPTPRCSCIENPTRPQPL